MPRFTDEQRQAIRELYPSMFASEIGQRIGLTNGQVQRWALEHHLQHSALTATEQAERRKQINRRHVALTKTPEAIEKRKATIRRMFKAERNRVLSGQPQQTKMRISTTSKRLLDLISRMTTRYGYFQYEGDPRHILYYDKQTRRRPLTGYGSEEYYSRKYGVEFREGDENDVKFFEE